MEKCPFQDCAAFFPHSIIEEHIAVHLEMQKKLRNIDKSALNLKKLKGKLSWIKNHPLVCRKCGEFFPKKGGIEKHKKNACQKNSQQNWAQKCDGQ